MRKCKLDSYSLDQIKQVYFKSNSTLEEAAKQFNVNAETLRLYLKKHKIQTKHSGFKSAIPNSDKHKIKDLYWNQNKTPKEIGKIYNRSANCVKTFMRKHNIQLKTPNIAAIPDLDKNKIKELYKTKSIKQIAKLYNCSSWQVANYMDKHNLDRKNKEYKFNFNKQDIDKMKDMYENQGKFLWQIAKEFNCTDSTIREIFKENNIDRVSAKIRNKEKAKDPKFLKRLMKSLWNRKPYTLPSGRIIKLMGYEPQFLDYIFKNNLLTEDEINYDPPIIPYTKNKEEHNYIPDFYIPKLNLIVEIKSQYILEKQKDQEFKEQAVRKAGYDYILVLDNDFNQLKPHLKQ